MPLTIQYLSVPVICIMAGRIGSIETYNKAEKDFETYCSRKKMCFLANKIVDDKKVAVFLTLAGTEVFLFGT